MSDDARFARRFALVGAVPGLALAVLIGVPVVVITGDATPLVGCLLGALLWIVGPWAIWRVLGRTK